MTQQIQAPENAPQAAAPKKKPFFKKPLFLILVVAVIIVIAVQSSKGGGNTDSSASASDPSAGSSAAAESATEPATEPATDDADFQIGQPAADGKFNFVVNGVDCSQTQIGNQYMNTTAQGQFCIVDVTVTNIGDKPQSFFGDNATLFNAQGQEFSADSEASIYLEDSSSLYEEINPGNTVSSKVIFDVPAGMVPTSIELHDSAFSGGVTVALQ
jgi:hypothetical protein